MLFNVKALVISAVVFNILSLAGCLFGQRIYDNQKVSSILRGQYSVVLTVVFAIFLIHTLILSIAFYRAQHVSAAVGMLIVTVSPFLISAKTSGLRTAEIEIWSQIAFLSLSLVLLGQMIG